MFAIVARLIPKAVDTAPRSPDISTTSALSIAMSVPVPTARPTSAAASAGASLMPSPTKATFRPPSRPLRPGERLQDAVGQPARVIGGLTDGITAVGASIVTRLRAPTVQSGILPISACCALPDSTVMNTLLALRLRKMVLEKVLPMPPNTSPLTGVRRLTRESETVVPSAALNQEPLAGTVR